MIQDHPFRADPNGGGLTCIFPVDRGGVVVHCCKLKAEHEDASHFAKRANPDFDFDLTYYISGPMSGYPDHNFPAFQYACDVLRNTGIKIESPHENKTPDGFETLDDEQKWVTMIAIDEKQMKDKCEGIILLKGWPQSRGSRYELGIAFELRWPVWYFDNTQLVNMNRDF